MAFLWYRTASSMYCHEPMHRNGFLKETSKAALTISAIDGCLPSAESKTTSEATLWNSVADVGDLAIFTIT
jgi:hypothetical protein